MVLDEQLSCLGVQHRYLPFHDPSLVLLVYLIISYEPDKYVTTYDKLNLGKL